MTDVQKCAICGRPVVVRRPLRGPGGEEIPDLRLGPDGRMRCIRHIGVVRQRSRVKSFRELAETVDHPPSQTRLD